MPISLEWVDEDKTIARVASKGLLSFDEVFAAVNILKQMGEDAAHPFGLVIDPDTPNFFPPRYGESLREVQRIHFPNLQIAVFVGDSIVWEFFRASADQLGKLSYRLVMKPTFEEAVDLIRCFLISTPPSDPRWN